MPYYMYVAVQEDNKISVFTVDPDTGGLAQQHDVSVPGGPFPLAISPDHNHLYCGTRETTGLTSPAEASRRRGRCRWIRGRST